MTTPRGNDPGAGSRPRPARKPTSMDVARLAGVSQSTVSYVLTGRRPISAETRRRVAEAIDLLGFVPNSGARALAGRRSNVIGLVVPFHVEQDRAVNMAFVGAIAAIAREREYDVLLVTADEGPAGMRRLRDSALCDAIMLMDVETDDPRVEVARDLGVPVVVIGVPADTRDVDCVDFDFEAAGRLAVDRLADHGHRDVAVLSPWVDEGRQDMSFARRFLRGVGDAARERGVALSDTATKSSYDDVLTALGAAFAAQPGATGLIVHSSAAVEPVIAALAASDRLGAPGASGDGPRPSRLEVIAVCSQEVAARQSGRIEAIALQPEAVSLRAMDVLFMALTDADERRPHAASVHLIAPAVWRPASGAFAPARAVATADGSPVVAGHDVGAGVHR